ncbi:MAG: N-acetylmuramoyl-L-alanine amidase [Spirochaetia bacterium]
MRLPKIAVILCGLLVIGASIGAQDKNILSLAGDLGAVLEWDPLRDTGIISFGDDRIALAVGADSALINYRVKVQIDAPVRKDGGVWLTTAAVGAIGDAVQRDRLAHAGEHLRVQYILLDPGHGGKDSGAVGSVAEGKRQVTLMEKDITLTVGRALAALLREGFPDKEVLLTRNDDTFVSLEDRVVIANGLLEKTKDTVLYVSIHANTSPFNKTASGFEVWCLPPSYERTLVDEKATGKENLDILPILNSMREEEISLESTVLAQSILAGLDATIGKRSADRGLRQNDWYVVRNARMPAVLTEVGFVSNSEEAPRLADPAYLNDVAKGMYNGVNAFIQGFERSGSGGAR